MRESEKERSKDGRSEEEKKRKKKCVQRGKAWNILAINNEREREREGGEGDSVRRGGWRDGGSLVVNVWSICWIIRV